MDRLYSSGAQILAEEAIQAEEAEIARAEEEERLANLGEDAESQNGDNSDSDESSPSKQQGPPPALTSPMHSDLQLPARRSQLAPLAPLPRKITLPRKKESTEPPKIMHRRTSVMQKRPSIGTPAQLQLCFAVLPAGCQNIPMEFYHVRGFIAQNSVKSFEMLLDGDENLEMKGLKYWRDQLRTLHQTCDKVKDDIKAHLEEKRNFFSFILTVVTVGLSPMTILT